MTAIVEYRSRLPMPAGMDEMDARRWRVLVETIFPSAKTPEAIVMALDYCRARGLDVFKRPVHIVPMWNSALRREVETVWPGINEIQTTAARTKQWAGMDEPKWGADVTRTLKGRKRSNNEWVNAEATITFPESCGVTVYRMIEGQRCAFTEPVYWLEAYSRAGGQGSELPTDMWVKRPRGQLHKVAKAASLRAAFPEEASDYSAEEMEGKEIEAGGVVIEHEPHPAPTTARHQRRGAPPPADDPFSDDTPPAGARNPAPPPSPPTNGNGAHTAPARALSPHPEEPPAMTAERTAATLQFWRRDDYGIDPEVIPGGIGRWDAEMLTLAEAAPNLDAYHKLKEENRAHFVKWSGHVARPVVEQFNKRLGAAARRLAEAELPA